MIRDLTESYLVVRDLVPEHTQAEMRDVLVGAWLAYADRITAGHNNPKSMNMHVDPFVGVAMKALAEAGYTDMGAAWAKWGLDNAHTMDEEQKRRKLEAIKATGNIVHVSAVNPAEAPDTSHCPKCSAEGRKFTWGYACSNAECRNSKTGKGTTWDDQNWSRIKFAVHGR